MTTLNLNTDDADRALVVLSKGYDVFSTAQINIKVQINVALRDSKNFVSSSAKEFFDEFDEFDGNLLLQIKELGLLHQNLLLEIEQWKRSDNFPDYYYPK